ncbi:hypothetical protein H6F88_00720 [Oculatella sp. FACHB-28]|uniref:hypothetical protein n=1 Tax=Oculatella sp. FACHB-28 TaxID=2692845 RepID=UPI001681F5E3|nr:hypothetical protein [Oculatella sp. FACHB-28]MBD2054565.1 hypothetical protein [Oculatella sp. FACHB-28]
MNIAIAFDEREQHFLAFVFMEVFGGGSTRIIQNILGPYVETAHNLQPKVRLQAEAELPSIELTADEWRVMYEALNAVIYGLGPSELHTCTGYNLQEACNINLRICAAVWDARGVGRAWVGS